MPRLVNPAFPRLVAHADWGSNADNRRMAVAIRDDGCYFARPPQAVGALDSLLQRLLDDVEEGEGIVVGFDFPIGLPAAFAGLAGIDDFLATLPELGAGEWEQFYNVAETADQIGITRPFYPFRTGGTSQDHLVQGLGVPGMDALLRQCEQSTENRGVASPLFWTLGAKQVGKAAILGWRNVLVPGIAAFGNDLAVWPFAGDFRQLTLQHRIVIAETYPAEAYVHLGFPPNGWSKRKQADRQAKGIEMLTWAAQRPVVCHPDLIASIRDGFGPAPEGEDPFDAVTGLFSMLDVILGYRMDGAPRNEAVRQIEGWMFGQQN